MTVLYIFAGIGVLAAVAGTGIVLIGWYERLFSAVGELVDPHRAVIEFWIERCKKRREERS